ncbi:uncharacterized protein N7482_008248 [Penicillium canariense]|uniref:Zn(2)-C6 fungal-type domain-containing protein n=1 Tax=Penicillium canariense TaxID=189055 RepID=A0A9W9HST4_9EURO|nr:uncharacterized protein N7482_008248 [Penicillium canariense]KAJ5157148.1 hypothetical protein N7482_008248 [Penicillium canariense]
MIGGRVDFINHQQHPASARHLTHVPRPNVENAIILTVMETTSSRKRPRPVVSCLRCREKKLKCDRATPCQNCTKAGCGARCTYNQHPHPIDSPPKPKRAHLPAEVLEDGRRTLGGPGAGIIEDLHQRVVKLEELIALQPDAGNFGPIRDAFVQNPWPPSDSNSSTSPFLGTLVVKGSRSRYHGQNHRITLLNQFPEAKAFINHCSADSTLVGLAKEVQFLQTKSLASTTSPESLSGLDSSAELQNLLSSLPPKSACDKLLEVYITNLEKTLRIIHVPSFLRLYTSFWQQSDQQSVPTVVPLLTAILAVAISFDPQTTSSDDSSSWEYLTQDAVKSLQAWLSKLPRKQRVDFATLQVETLLLLSYQLRLEPPEELWKASGSLVRSGMMMGLHVNLSQSSNLSFFQAECRRRLWITIVEMDLQASITSGMPVMTPELDFGPLTPSNLNDADFDESTSDRPSAIPLSEETDSIAQITLAASLSHRVRVMNTVQHTSPRDNLSERVKQGQRLQEYISEVPSHLNPRHDAENASPALVLNRVLLDIFLRRPLLCLFRPVITHSTPEDPSFHSMQRACLDSSLAVLSYQDYFDPNITGLDVVNPNAYWNVFQAFCQNDILWAALSPVILPSPFSFCSQAPSKASLSRLVDNTLDSLTRRIHEKGSNVKDLLLLTVVLQSARFRGSAEQREQRMLQGAKSILSACRQYLLSKATEQFVSSDLADLAHMIQPIEPIALHSHSRQRVSTPQFQFGDIEQPPSALAAEFDSFVGDLFSIGDESYMWNM